MANKTTIALTESQVFQSIKMIQTGFVCTSKKYKGRVVRPNERLATLLLLQANVGLRISDILLLRLNDIVRDGDRYRLNIIEKKTKKVRNFTVPDQIYMFLQSYVIKYSINPNARIFPITERAVQKMVDVVAAEMHIENMSTHSYRKYFGLSIYEENNNDIRLVQILYQHSSPAVTQRYLKISETRVEDALRQHVKLI